MKNLFRSMKRSTILSGSTYILVTVAFLAMYLMSNMGMLGSAMKGHLIPICVYIVMAVSLNLVVGISGELSLGHAGFMGVGAFTGIVISTLAAQGIENDILRLAVSMLGGGVIAAVIGCLISIPVLRLRGDYLAIVTLAFGEILKNIVGNLYVGLDAQGLRFGLSEEAIALAEEGKMIISGPRGALEVEKLATFPMGYVLIMVSLFVVFNIINSKEGRAIKAIRDNRIAAESVGIHATTFKMKAFVISAFLAGMAGALYGLNYSNTVATKFSFNTSINVLIFVVLGGMGNILGSVISATVLYILPESLRGLDDYRMILYAIVLILVMLGTWSPKVKDLIARVADNVKSLFKRKGVGKHD